LRGHLPIHWTAAVRMRNVCILTGATHTARIGRRWSKWLVYFGLSSAILLVPGQVEAQIYSWRDANGNLVLSSKPSGSLMRTYAVPEADSIRVTRPVAAAGTERAKLYDGLIDEHARQNGIRRDLVRAVVHVESGFNPSARSPKGALGLMQLMPATI